MLILIIKKSRCQIHVVSSCNLLLPPDHLVDDAGVGLDEFDDLGADIFVSVGRHRDAVVSVLHHLDCYVNCLEQVVFVDAGKNEASFVKGFRTLGGCAYADCREGVAYAGEE